MGNGKLNNSSGSAEGIRLFQIPMSMPFASSATILLPLIVQLMLFPILRTTSMSWPRIADMVSSYKTVVSFMSIVTAF